MKEFVRSTLVWALEFWKDGFKLSKMALSFPTLGYISKGSIKNLIKIMGLVFEKMVGKLDENNIKMMHLSNILLRILDCHHQIPLFSRLL